LQDQSAATVGYGLFGKDMLEGQGGRVTIHGKEQLEHMELCLSVDDVLRAYG